MASFDLDEPPTHAEDEHTTEEIEKELKKFREGGRFEYNDSQKNYFEIKHWWVALLKVKLNIIIKFFFT